MAEPQNVIKVEFVMKTILEIPVSYYSTNGVSSEVAAKIDQESVDKGILAASQIVAAAEGFGFPIEIQVNPVD